MALGYLSGGVELQQVPGQLPGGSLDPFLNPGPLGGAQAGQGGGLVMSPHVGRHPVQVVRGHVEPIVVGVLQHQVLFLLPRFAHPGGPGEAGHAVVHVDDVVAGDQLGEDYLPPPFNPGLPVAAFLDRAK